MNLKLLIVCKNVVLWASILVALNAVALIVAIAVIFAFRAFTGNEPDYWLVKVYIIAAVISVIVASLLNPLYDWLKHKQRLEEIA